MKPTILIRPIAADDEAPLEAFYAGLSDESRRSRFFASVTGVSHRQSAFFSSADHRHREGFVAELVAGRDRPPRIVGHLCIEPEGRSTAEIAIAVADAHQRRGIGRRLMVNGIRWARRRGLSSLSATMLVDNPGIQHLLADLGLPWQARFVGAGVSEIRIDLGHTARVAA